MSALASLILILFFLSGLYTLLGLVCTLAEKAQEVLTRPHYRRRARKAARRRPRRGLDAAARSPRALRPFGWSLREGTA